MFAKRGGWHSGLLTLGLGLLLILISCTDSDGGSSLDTMSTRLNDMDARLGNIEARLGHVEGDSESLEARLDSVEAALDDLESTPIEPDDNETAPPAEVDGGHVVGAGLVITFADEADTSVIPIDEVLNYPGFDAFDLDWATLTTASIKMAWIPTENGWDFFHSDVMFDNSAGQPDGWRNYRVVAPYSLPAPDAGAESMVSTVSINYSPLETIEATEVYSDTAVMLTSRTNLNNLTDGEIGDESQILLLVSERSQGQDTYKFVVIEESGGGPADEDDPITAESCSVCFSWRCRWRCWWYGYPTP